MTGEALVTLSAANWAEEVEKASEPVLVDFGASWCPPCRLLAPIIAELATEYSGTVKVGAVDVDVEQQIAAQYGIMGLPTLLLFKQGQPVDRIVGFTPKKELKSRIDAQLG